MQQSVDPVGQQKRVELEALRLWSTRPVGFVDAYLGARAVGEGRPVFTRNVGHVESCGADVPAKWPT